MAGPTRPGAVARWLVILWSLELAAVTGPRVSFHPAACDPPPDTPAPRLPGPPHPV